MNYRDQTAEQRARTLKENRAIRNLAKERREAERTHAKQDAAEREASRKRYPFRFKHADTGTVWEGNDLWKATIDRFGEEEGLWFYANAFFHAGRVYQGWIIEKIVL